MTPMTPATYLGIDVATDFLDLAVRPSGQTLRVANEPAALATALARVGVPQLTVLLEASGGYERVALRTLQAAQVPVARVNPRQVRDCARATGQLAKTDRIDAALLAHYGEAMRPTPTPPGNAATEHLAALVERRRQLVTMREAERNRQRAAPAAVVEDLTAHSAFLAARIATLDAQIAAAVAADPSLTRRAALLRSAPGGGPVLAATLLADLPELGHGSGKELAALVASRHNPTLRTFYQRLLAAAKPKQLALVACRRKLLVILNAMVRHDTPFQEDYHAPRP
jgi:transposase